MLVQCSFPVLLDVKRPLELQVDVVVIVDKLGNGGVMSSSQHARWGCLMLDYASSVIMLN